MFIQCTICLLHICAVRCMSYTIKKTKKKKELMERWYDGAMMRWRCNDDVDAMYNCAMAMVWWRDDDGAIRVLAPSRYRLFCRCTVPRKLSQMWNFFLSHVFFIPEKFIFLPYYCKINKIVPNDFFTVSISTWQTCKWQV